MTGSGDASIAIALKFLDQATAPMNSALRQIQGNTAATQSAMESLTGSVGRFVTSMVGIGTAIAAIKSLGTMGTQFNSDIEGATVGIATLLAAQGKFVDSQGKELTGRERINASLTYSTQLVQGLQLANLKTVATMQELVRAFQVTLAPGLAEGLSVPQIKEYTVAMVQAASAMQIPLDMMAEETRSLLKGTITSRNTLIATALGITNDDIRRLQGDAQGLFNFVMGKLKAFADYGSVTASTYSGLISNAKDALSFILGKTTFPFFTELKSALSKFVDYAIQADEATGKISINPELIRSFELLNDVLRATLATAELLASALAKVGSVYGAIKAASDKALYLPGSNQAIPTYAVPFTGAAGTGFGNESLTNDEYRLQTVKKLMADIVDYQKTINEQASKLSYWKGGELFDSLKSIMAEIGNSEAINTLQSFREQMVKAGQDTAELDSFLQNLRNDISASGQDTSRLDEILKQVGQSSKYVSDQQGDAANAVKEFSFQAGNATLSAAKFKDVLQDLAGISLENLGRDLTKSIAELEAKAKAASQGLSSGAQSAEAKYAMRQQELNTAEYWAKYRNVEPSVLNDIAGKRQQAEVERYWNLYIDGANKAWRETRKSGGGSGPIDIERIDQSVHRFREKMSKLYRELSNLDADYEADRLEASGYYYEAEESRMLRQVTDRKAAYAKEVADAEQAYKEMQQKLSTKRGATVEALAEIERLGQEWETAKTKAEEYNAKIDRNTQQELQLMARKRQLSGAIELAQTNLEYVSLTGTMEQVYQAEIALIEASEAERLANVDKNIPALEEAYKKLYAAQKRIAELKNPDASFFSGFLEGLQDLQKELTTTAEDGREFVKDLSSSFKSEFGTFWNDFFSGEYADAADAAAGLGKAVANAFASAFSNYLSKQLSRSFDSIFDVLGGIFGNLFGSGGGTTFTSAGGASWNSSMNFLEHHSGGIVGLTGGKVRTGLNPALLSIAPELHTGLSPDEYPAILQSGEEVISRSDRATILKELRSSKKQSGSDNSASGQSVSVNITNQSNSQIKAETASAKFNVKLNKWVIDVVLSDFAQGGSIWQMVRGAKG